MINILIYDSGELELEHTEDRGDIGSVFWFRNSKGHGTSIRCDIEENINKYKRKLINKRIKEIKEELNKNKNDLDIFNKLKNDIK